MSTDFSSYFTLPNNNQDTYLQTGQELTNPNNIQNSYYSQVGEELANSADSNNTQNNVSYLQTGQDLMNPNNLQNSYYSQIGQELMNPNSSQNNIYTQIGNEFASQFNTQLPNLSIPNINANNTQQSLISPNAKRVPKIIARVTEMAYCLNTYTFGMLTIPNISNYLKEWANVASKTSNDLIDFTFGTVEKDFLTTWNAPLYLTEDDVTLFMPYSLEATQVNLPQVPMTDIEMDTGAVNYFGKIQSAGDLHITYTEFMHPIITKLHSYWISLLNTITTNSFLKISLNNPPKPLYGYITLIMMTPDIRQAVSAISFLNCLPTKDIISDLFTMQVNAVQLTKIEVDYKFQTYRRFFIDDNDFNTLNPYNGGKSYVYNAFARLMTIPESEWANLVSNNYGL